jgi:hypothetical protein
MGGGVVYSLQEIKWILKKIGLIGFYPLQTLLEISLLATDLVNEKFRLL